LIVTARDGATTGSVASSIAVNVMVVCPVWSAVGVQTTVAVAGFPSWKASVAPTGKPVAVTRTRAVTVPSDAATESVNGDPTVAESTDPGAGDGAAQLITGTGSGTVSACADTGTSDTDITAARPRSTSGRRIAFITAQ
jgi:hypothetical protein